jgi:hypothetical protein
MDLIGLRGGLVMISRKNSMVARNGVVVQFLSQKVSDLLLDQGHSQVVTITAM